jgi:hypothetical protein
LRFSFAAQCNHWIDARGASRGQETRQAGDEREQSRDGKVDRRIERIDLEENVLQRGGRDDTEEQRDATSAENQTDRS